MNILSKIKKAGLIGRGGACFPTAKKWEAVEKAKREKKYIVCNAAEGEPGVEKDGYILEKFPERVIDGIKIVKMSANVVGRFAKYAHLRI